MIKLYEFLHWLAAFIVLSLLIVITTLMGGIIFGLIPSLKAGILTIEATNDEIDISIFELMLIYVKLCKKQVLLTRNENIFFVLLVLINLKIVMNDSHDGWNYLWLWLGAFLFAFCIFFIQASLIQSGSGFKATLIYLCLNIKKVVFGIAGSFLWVLSLIVAPTFSWIFSIGFLCYFMSRIKHFGSVNDCA